MRMSTKLNLLTGEAPMRQPILTPYLDGHWQPRRRRPAEPVTDPYTGRRLAWLVAGSDADLEAAITGTGGPTFSKPSRPCCGMRAMRWPG